MVNRSTNSDTDNFITKVIGLIAHGERDKAVDLIGSLPSELTLFVNVSILASEVVLLITTAGDRKRVETGNIKRVDATDHTQTDSGDYTKSDTSDRTQGDDDKRLSTREQAIIRSIDLALELAVSLDHHLRLASRWMRILTDGYVDPDMDLSDYYARFNYPSLQPISPTYIIYVRNLNIELALAEARGLESDLARISNHNCDIARSILFVIIKVLNPYAQTSGTLKPIVAPATVSRTNASLVNENENTSHFRLLGLDTLTPQTLSDTVMPYLQAMADAQKSISDIQGAFYVEPKIKLISQNSLVEIKLLDVAAIIKIIRDMVIPWRRKNAQLRARIAAEKAATESNQLYLAYEKEKLSLVDMAIEIVDKHSTSDLPEHERFARAMQILKSLNILVDSSLDLEEISKPQILPP